MSQRDEVMSTAFRERWRLANEQAKIRQLKEQQLREFAKALAVKGTIFIPSDELENNMVVVSREVYDVVKRELL